MNTFSIQEAIRFGWETFKKDTWFFILVTLVLVAFSMIVNGLTSHGTGLFALVGWLIGVAASTVVTIAYWRLGLSANAGQHVGWEGLWAPEHFWRMFAATFLVGVIVIVGLILFIIPGIIASLFLCFTQILIVDKSVGPIEAIKESCRLAKGHLFQLFLFFIVIALLNIVGAIFLLVGLLVSIPVSVIAFAHAYKKIQSLHGAPIV